MRLWSTMMMVLVLVLVVMMMMMMMDFMQPWVLLRLIWIVVMEVVGLEKALVVGF